MITRQGDCYETAASLTTCPATTDSCSVFTSSTTTVSKCQNKKADYVLARWRCIPGTFIGVYKQIFFLFS